MKKIATTFVCLVLLLSISSIGFAEEEFKLRNGIMFGDTIEEIVAKETSLTREGENSNWFKGKIAGYSNAECGFYFDDNGKLISMDYSFSESCTSRESTNDVYKKLYQSLVRQYGKAEGNTGGSVELITGPAIDRMAMWVYLLGSFDKCAGDYYDYDEWIIDSNDYHVKIDLVSYYYRNSDYEYSYFLDLSYHMYTDEEYLAKIDEKISEQNEVDDDL